MKSAVRRDALSAGAQPQKLLQEDNSVGPFPSCRAGISADDVLQTSKVFVGGIASTVTTQDLYEYFGKYGEVEDVQVGDECGGSDRLQTDGSASKVMVDPQTHRSRGFAFVTFKHAETVQNVMNYQEHELHNKRVEIKLAVPKSVQRAQVRMLMVGTS